MMFEDTRQRSGPKLKIATILSYALIASVLILSLTQLHSVTTQTEGGSASPSSPWTSSWSTWTPFSASHQDDAQVSLTSADGLSGDFIPASETRASQGALKSMGQKKSLFDNLRDDKKYMTSFPVAGWNNQVICTMHLLYFSMRSHRIPIIPDFTPHTGHLNADHAPLMRFGHVFDVPRLSALLESPIVEMTELKSNGEERNDTDRWTYDDEFSEFQEKVGEYTEDELPESETIGCWSWAKTTRYQEPQYGRKYAIQMENTPLPEYTIGANYVHGVDVKSFIDMLQHHSTINELDTYQAAIISNHSNLVVPETLPTDKLACVDELYYLDAGDTSSEINYDPHDGGGIAWNEIGRHMYFHPVLRKLTHSILRKTFGLPEDAKIPSYVAVHIRRTDFLNTSPFTILDYSFHVAKVIRQTENFMGFRPERVLVMTDETDEEWLAELQEYGWVHIDHVALRTPELYGPWYTTFIDAVALSEGVGLVGLHQSSMAQLAYTRVRTWHGGAGSMIRPHQKAPDGYVYPYKPEI